MVRAMRAAFRSVALHCSAMALLFTPALFGTDQPRQLLSSSELASFFRFYSTTNDQYIDKYNNRQARFRATLAFLTDTTLAVQVCQLSGTGYCELQVFTLTDGQLHPMARAAGIAGGELHRAHDGFLLVHGDGQGSLFSQDLTKQEVFGANLVSNSGNTFATTGSVGRPPGLRATWTAYRTYPSVEIIKEGTGQLLSISDEGLLAEEKGRLYFERFDGTQRGEINGERGELVEGGRVFQDSGYLSTQVSDVNGRFIGRLQRPKGEAEMYWNSNADRVLFDCFDEHKSFARKVGDVLVPFGQTCCPNNEERIRVVEVNTGKICFNYYQRISFQDRHADISPSGELVAVLTRSSIEIYRLPAHC